MKDIELNSLENYIESLREQMVPYKEAFEQINEKLEEAIELFQNECPHSETEEKTDYIPGGYLDREEYITYIYCKRCGVLINKIIKLGGFS